MARALWGGLNQSGAVAYLLAALDGALNVESVDRSGAKTE
jgi:hypothetical protein